MNRVLGSLAVLFAAAGLGFADDPKEDEANEKRAEVNVRNLAVAAKAYRVKHTAWPEKLADLTKPKDGQPAFVKADAKDLKDPWGNDYKYEVAKDAKGEEKAYVWAERVVGGQTKVYGDKPPGKKDEKKKPADPKEEEVKGTVAGLRARSIVLACEAYRANPANAKGVFPASLKDLVTPPFGGAAYLKNAQADLLDPWGREFRYEVVTDDKGGERPYVWTERTADGKTTVYGEKPPKKKV
jgi:hypothetical protein